MTVGFMVSPLLQSRLDCKYINMIFLGSMSVSMLGLGLSFLRPSLGPALSIPCLVVAHPLLLTNVNNKMVIFLKASLSDSEFENPT